MGKHQSSVGHLGHVAGLDVIFVFFLPLLEYYDEFSVEIFKEHDC